MKTRTRRLLAELHELLDGPSDETIAREIVVYELVAAALLLGRPGKNDLSAAAAAARERFEAFPCEEWPGLLDQARDVMRQGASDASWPERSGMLEQLIAEVQAAT